jgi:predicted TIM-barrel fold metal-dependent hydrolase
MNTLPLIDFHHHGRPASFYKALNNRGITIFGGRGFPPASDPEATLAMMDRVGLSQVIISAPDAESLFSDKSFGQEQARSINEHFASMVKRWPNRFGAFVTLPMPHIQESLDEIKYGLDTLGFDGVLILSSCLGRYSGSAEFDPILEECNRRGTLVFVHPATPVGMDLLKINIPSFVLEFVNDTTRCITNMLMNDVPRRFPRIRFLFSHAGGNIPFLAPRLALLDLFANPDNTLTIPEARAKALAGIRNFYYDTALSAVDSVFSTLKDTVGLDRVVFGSDAPQAPESFVAATAQGLRESKVLSNEEKYAIAQGTGQRLLPRLFPDVKTDLAGPLI